MVCLINMCVGELFLAAVGIFGVHAAIVRLPALLQSIAVKVESTFQIAYTGITKCTCF